MIVEEHIALLWALFLGAVGHEVVEQDHRVQNQADEDSHDREIAQRIDLLAKPGINGVVERRMLFLNVVDTIVIAIDLRQGQGRGYLSQLSRHLLADGGHGADCLGNLQYAPTLNQVVAAGELGVPNIREAAQRGVGHVVNDGFPLLLEDVDALRVQFEIVGSHKVG